MPRPIRWTPAALLLGACGPASAPTVAPLVLPDSVEIRESATGASVTGPELLGRLSRADFVLLGELHDNAVHHRVRGALITASGRRPAVVFEQLAATTGPIPPPVAGQSREAWLDANGFDRPSWRWPLHAPVVEAALGSARSIWGSNLSRETLRATVREGLAGAPAELRPLVERVPLDSGARAALDRDLVDSHCGQLPASMVPGMRVAQELRDAAMTRALLSAGESGPAWLIAGNGHVRADIGVPRMLRRLAPGRSVLVVGLVERDDGAVRPIPAEARSYDVVIVTPRAARPDPCAGFRR